MLPFNEIKKDIKNGYSYFTYEGKWYGYGFHIEFETRYNTFYVCFVTDKNFFAEYRMYLDDFMEITSYKEYVKLMNEVIYYNGYTVGDEQ